VILDRDGTINYDSDLFVKSPDEWLPIEGSLEAIALFNQHGYKVVVITNQSGVGRGFFDMETLDAMHDKMQRLAAKAGGHIEAIYACTHGPDQECGCRKPKPGLFLSFAADKQVDLAEIYAIGDSFRDIEAALTAGAKPILVKTGKGLKTLKYHPHFDYPIFENLYDAAKYIVSQS